MQTSKRTRLGILQLTLLGIAVGALVMGPSMSVAHGGIASTGTGNAHTEGPLIIPGTYVTLYCNGESITIAGNPGCSNQVITRDMCDSLYCNYTISAQSTTFGSGFSKWVVTGSAYVANLYASPTQLTVQTPNSGGVYSASVSMALGGPDTNRISGGGYTSGTANGCAYYSVDSAPTENAATGTITMSTSAGAVTCGVADITGEGAFYSETGTVPSSEIRTVSVDWYVDWSASVVTGACYLGASYGEGYIEVEANVEDVTTGTWVLNSNAVIQVWYESLGCGLSWIAGNGGNHDITFSGDFVTGQTYVVYTQLYTYAEVGALGLAAAYADNTLSGGDYATYQGFSLTPTP